MLAGSFQSSLQAALLCRPDVTWATPVAVIASTACILTISARCAFVEVGEADA